MAPSSMLSAATHCVFRGQGYTSAKTDICQSLLMCRQGASVAQAEVLINVNNSLNYFTLRGNLSSSLWEIQISHVLSWLVNCNFKQFLPVETQKYKLCDSKFRTVQLPVSLCKTSHTEGSSDGWSVSHDTLWHSYVSMCETPSPSWWWLIRGQWWGMDHGCPCWKSHTERWLTGWSFPSPFHLLVYSFF